jgi:hypothetical protein
MRIWYVESINHASYSVAACCTPSRKKEASFAMSAKTIDRSSAAMSQADNGVCPEQFRGWLLKWTNYIKGYQRRWFVLSNGLLSYYRCVCCDRR